jgi:hypothetical protein
MSTFGLKRVPLLIDRRISGGELTVCDKGVDRAMTYRMFNRSGPQLRNPLNLRSQATCVRFVRAAGIGRGDIQAEKRSLSRRE